MPLRTILVAAALALAACGSRSSGRLAVSASIAGPAAGPATGALALGNGITVDRVRLVVREIELEGSAAAPAPASPGSPTMLSGTGRSGQDDGGGGDDDGEGDEVQVGPFLVDLSGAELTSGITRVFDADVPAGTYREISIDVRAADASDAGASSALAAMAGSSVIVDGTVDGRAFSFTSSLRAKQKRESTIVVGAGSSNVTLSIDPTGWFGTGGARLDPGAAADRSAIEANIAASIDVFGDDDEDGHDDHGHDGPGHQ